MSGKTISDRLVRLTMGGTLLWAASWVGPAWAQTSPAPTQGVLGVWTEPAPLGANAPGGMLSPATTSAPGYAARPGGESMAHSQEPGTGESGIQQTSCTNCGGGLLGRPE